MQKIINEFYQDKKMGNPMKVMKAERVAST